MGILRRIGLAVAMTATPVGFTLAGVMMPVQPVTPVPALDTWGLLGLAAVVGIAGLFTLRRSK
jgi:hypothetical protein